MALDRFSNIEEIQNTNGKVRGIVWNADDYDVLKLDLINVAPEQRPTVEIHLYTIGTVNTYVTGGVIDDFEIKDSTLSINYGKACQSLGIERGQFEVVVNVYKNLLGNEEQPELYIKEISDTRRELWIKATPDSDLDIETYLNSFGAGAYAETIYETDQEGNEVLDEKGEPIIRSVIERPLSDDVYLNLGNNRLLKVINQKDWNDENDFVVRLYGELPEEFETKAPLWVVEQLADSYVDNIDLQGPGAIVEPSRELLGPNFEIDPYGSTITETDFKSWNELLDANTSTSQQIVDRLFSGSLDTAINIDYSGFQNFIHFSSAKERLTNFKYKLQLIEYYDSQITTLTNATGDDSDALQGNIATNRARRDSVIGTFDGFERWLYNEPTSSIFTHHDSVYSNNNNDTGVYRADGGYIGAKPYRLTSWPKFLSGSKYYLHHTTSSIAEDWFDGFSSTASLYDSENNSSLVRTIPEHIRTDSSNDQYELFVNMIGQHFDILYTHIDNLTRVYKPQEHPKLGQSKETLYEVAKSLGWTLQNGNQAEQLWKYKLGVDSGSGAYATTGSLFSKSNEEITTEVWRRIVNNLPFLLKTKGTARSIKALMNTYGIPQTLLSIREYGGPKVDEDTPSLIEDRFTYAVQFLSGSAQADVSSAGAVTTDSPVIKWIEDFYNTDIGDWGFVRNGLSSGDDIPIQTHEYRFKPAVKETMLLHNTVWFASPTDERNATLVVLEHTASYSGSDEYGRILYGHGQAADVLVASSSWAPFYNGEFWNLRHWCETTASVASTLADYNAADSTGIRYTVQAQMASDYIDDKVLHSVSASVIPDSVNHKYGWAVNSGYGTEFRLGGETAQIGNTKNWGDINTKMREALGETGVSTDNELPLPIMTFSGSMQEYRGWLEVLDQATFNLHTTNPTSYVSSISPTSSYDTLIRHYPLGTDSNAISHRAATGNFITSSHPAVTITDFSDTLGDGFNSYATASNFPAPTNAERGNYVPVEETYYIQGVSLGANVPRSQKIRFDENKLVRRLTPTNTAERSRFDRAPIDTNRLGLFYSAADQINKDIFNQIGDVALDDYVGDPDHEFTFEYPDLTHFSKEYWKKYTDRNDLNAFVRIFSQFDFSLFEQIKQLLPERVDEAMGVLIEPHALERVKVKLADRPVPEELHYEGTIPEPVKDVTGDIIPLSGSISSAPTIEPAQVYHVGSSGYSDSGNYLAHLSGSNSGIPGGDPYDGTVYKHIYKIFPYKIAPAAATDLNLPREITASLPDLTTSPTGSVILKQRVSNIYKLDILHYSGSATLNKVQRNIDRVVSQSLGQGRPSIYNYSRSMADADYMDDFFEMDERKQFQGSQITSPGFNQASTIAALDFKPVIEIFETNPNTLVFNPTPNATNPGSLEVR